MNQLIGELDDRNIKTLLLDKFEALADPIFGIN